VSAAGQRSVGAAAAGDDTVLSLNNVTSGYGRTTVLRSVDLAVAKGAVVALLGPNGAGKTTLLRTAIGLIKPSTGTTRCAERTSPVSLRTSMRGTVPA